jgi:hypothetical protein
VGFTLYNSFCSTFIEVLFWGRQGLYIGWSIYGCILGLVLVVLGWRYWAGGRLGRVGTVTRGRVEAVAVGSDFWAGCGACVGGAYADGACTGGACVGRACAGGACVDGACRDRACVGGACGDGACTGGACMGGACGDGA